MDRPKGQKKIQKYRLIKNPDFGSKDNEYAMILDCCIDKPVLFAVLESDCFAKHGFHFSGGLGQMNDRRQICIVYFDEMYLGFFKKMPMIIKPLLLHELGHIINGDLNNDKSARQIREERANMAALGIVDPRELKADRFAAENSDYLRTIRALKFLREKRSEDGRPGTDLALREFDLRIEALRNNFKMNNRKD